MRVRLDHYTSASASKARQVKRGVKEVVKGIRKGEQGQVIYSVLLATLAPFHSQVTRSCRGHQSNRHYIPSPCTL